MKKVIAFFVRYPIWTNVLMFSIVGFGLLSWRGMKYSFFPELPPDMIIVEVELIGGSPEEVEEGVVIKMEENIEGIEGIERITSVSRENSARVIVEVMKGEDVDKVLQDVKNAVDRISSFPRASEKPVIYERKYRDDVMSIVLLGETDLFNLKYVADEMRDELLAMPEISQVTISGLPRLEFSIEVTEADLRRYLFTFDEIAQAVAAANINISGGKLETPEEEILIRTWGRKYYANQLNGLVVRGNPDGTVMRLSDIATVEEKWEDIPDKVYYNTRNAVKISIEKTGQEDILAIAERVKDYLNQFNEKNSNIQAIILNDTDDSLRAATLPAQQERIDRSCSDRIPVRILFKPASVVLGLSGHTLFLCRYVYCWLCCQVLPSMLFPFWACSSLWVSWLTMQSWWGRISIPTMSRENPLFRQRLTVLRKWCHRYLPRYLPR